MRKGTVIFLFAVMFFAAFASCSIETEESEDPEDPIVPTYEISGTVNNALSAENLTIGSFRFDSMEGFSNDILGEEDIVYDTGFGVSVTSGEYTPLGTTTPNADNTFSFELPDPEMSTDLQIIAWIDTDVDGVFDLGTETGYFPWRDYNSEAIRMQYISSGWASDSSVEPDMYFIVFYDDSISDFVSLNFDSTDQGHLNWYFNID